MLNVAVVCEFPTLLGGERSLLAAVDAMPLGTITFTAIVPPGALADQWRRRGADIVPWSRRAANSLGEARAQLTGILDRTGPDLVHANSLAMGRLIGPLARAMNIPSIAHLRDVVNLGAAAMRDLAANSRLLAVSEAVRSYYMARKTDCNPSYSEGELPCPPKEIAAEKMFVLHNGVDLSQFAPRPATGFFHAEFGLPPGTPLVVSIGQIILRKGWDVLAGAAERVIAAGADAHFVLIGARHSDKPETRELEERLRLAARTSLAGRLHLLGERTDVARILPEATLVVHTARQEPLGRVLLEAAACSRAIVATDVGGTREIFPPDSEAATLVAVDDADAIAAAILDLLPDVARREAIGARARRQVELQFDARHTAAGLLRHYREAAAP